MQTYPPGTRIGQYEIASRPMMGGMGVVYFALDHGNNGRPVAIKTFRPELLPNREARDRFLREGTAWIELGSHPHIVRCYKVEYIDPTAFLVLELIAKELNMPDASLRSWLIPGHPLPIEQALLFALQIARGMQHATEKIPGFVHRDLKPENILVGADKLPETNINRLRVTDFGLVKTIAGSDITARAGDEEQLKPNQVQFTRGAGTPLYMAPEQWKGEPVGVFTDVYAFGCILYEMLGGQPATSSTTISELQSAHCNGKLRSMPVSLPKDVSALIKKCLILNPDHRYTTWKEITDGLEQIYFMHTKQAAPPLGVFTKLGGEERVQVGWSYNAMGAAYDDIGKADAAVGYFEKAIEVAHEMDDRRGEGVFLSNLGSTYTKLGRVKQAIDHHEQAITIAHETNYLRGESAALGSLGTAYLQLGEVMRAINSYKQALAINHKLSDKRGESSVLSSLGNAYADLGDTRQAIDNYEQALAIDRKIGNRRGEGAILTNLGLVYAALGNVQKAIKFHEESLMIVREIGDRLSEGSALGNLGSAYAALGESQQAIDYYKKALAIDREVGDRRGEDADLGNLGNIYAALGEARQAIGYYEQALAIDREIGDRRGEGTDLGNLGNAYRILGNVQMAISYYEQALAIHREISNADGVARHLYNIANCFAKQNDFARALPMVQEAVRIWSQIESPNAQRAQTTLMQIQQDMRK